MTSGKQRRAELKTKRRAKRLAKEVRTTQEERTDAESRRTLVNKDALAPYNTLSTPHFVERGYYRDQKIVCQDCKTVEIWKAEQQKWWYEVAKGDVWTIGRRCRQCRRRERERRAEARRVHLEGLARKKRKDG